MKHWIPALSLAFATSAALAGSSSPRDGLLDPNFAVGGDRVVEFDLGPNGTDLARTAVVDAEDRIYLVGDVETPGGTRIGIVRLRADGDIDDTYGGNGDGRLVAPAAGQPIRVGGAAFDASGHLLVAGSRVIAGNDTNFLVCRASPAGALVPFAGSGFACAQVAFDLGGDRTDHAEAIVVQPDGRIVLAGLASTAGGGTELALARLMPNGELDPSFGDGGRTTFLGEGYWRFSAASLHLASDGSFTVAGTAVDGNAAQFGFVSRLDANGVVDMEFGNMPGFARAPNIHSIYTDAIYDEQAERIVVIGAISVNTPYPRGYAACYLDYGNLAPCPGGFSPTLTFDAGVAVAFDDLVRQPDGRWLVAGTWKPVDNGPWRTLLMRIGRDLSVDAHDFAAPDGYIGHSYGDEYDLGYAVALQRSRIVVAGVSKHAGGPDYGYAVSGYQVDRLFANGLDP